MEQEFYKDEFAQMLRETTEDFKMYPSRRVWYSIYNNFHPDRKWPSLAICLLLLTAILYIGVSNNNHISNVSRTTFENSHELVSPLSPSANIIAEVIPMPEQHNLRSTQVPPAPNPLPQPALIMSSVKTDVAEVNATSQIISKNEVIIPVLETEDKVSIASTETSLVSQQDLVVTISTTNKIGMSNAVIAPLRKDIKPINTANVLGVVVKNNETISWMENDVFYNLRHPGKWKAKMSLQYYITPSIGYRSLYKNYDYEPTSSSLLLRSVVVQNSVVNQQGAINLEAGFGLAYGASKKLRLKSGLQFNVSNYVTYAHELKHPTQATVLMNNLHDGSVWPKTFATKYANVLGSNFNMLDNRTVQLSLPLGADYTISSNEKLSWHVAATAQPGVVLTGDAYLISSDLKNFVEDASMIRKFNVNTAIESFVAFKAGNGLEIGLGPQFRYQLLSTYKKEYTYTEKLFNLGLKLGITRKL